MRRPVRGICTFLVLLAALLVLPAATLAAPFGSWTATGDLATARLAGHSATLLPNGNVLVAGGAGPGGARTASAELYDPTTGSWAVTGSMRSARAWHSATLLDDGRVLVAGGQTGSCTDTDADQLASAEIYDPATGRWSTTGSMHDRRSSHSSTLLPDGRVLVAGGWQKCTSVNLATAELFDPTTGTWERTGDLHEGGPRNGENGDETAVVLADGRVLVAGGVQCCPYIAFSETEFYTPSTGAWTITGALNDPRMGTQLVQLADGSPFTTGGATGVCCPWDAILESAERYDVATATWLRRAPMGTPRTGHSATPLVDGRVLVAGGSSDDLSIDSAELYDPASDTWSPTPPMRVARRSQRAVRLNDGRVLVVGGERLSGEALSSVEIFTPTAVTTTTTTVPGCDALSGIPGIRCNLDALITLAQDGSIPEPTKGNLVHSLTKARQHGADAQAAFTGGHVRSAKVKLKAALRSMLSFGFRLRSLHGSRVIPADLRATLTDLGRNIEKELIAAGNVM